MGLILGGLRKGHVPPCLKRKENIKNEKGKAKGKESVLESNKDKSWKWTS